MQEIWNVPHGTCYELPGYSPIEFRIRDPTRVNNNAGGGVAFWVDDRYEYEIIEDLSIFKPNVFESLFIKLKIKKNKFKVIGNVYRPNTAPQADLPYFISAVDEILNKVSTDARFKNCEIDLIGDMNLDLLKYNTHDHTSQYLECLLSNGQLPLICLPTRINENTATLIDHISTSHRSDNYNAGIIISSISDHLPIFYIQSSDNDISKYAPLKTRKINPTTTEKFLKILDSKRWYDVTDENRPKVAFETFFNTIEAAVELSFPETEIKLKSKNISLSPWMTRGLLTSRNKKEKLFSLKIRKPTELHKEKFRIYNNLYNSVKRQAKQSYYGEKFREYSKNMKKSWDLIREVVGHKKRRDNIPDFFRHNGQVLNSSGEIAEAFNDFFVNVGPNLACKIPQSVRSFNSYLGTPIKENFTFQRITRTMVVEMCGKLKPKASFGLDCISTKLLKLMLPQILTPLCHLFNLSVQTGYIPSQLKTAKVVPVFKSGDAHDFTSYRPISLLSSFSKLFEKIIAKQMITYMNKLKILYIH